MQAQDYRNGVAICSTNWIKKAVLADQIGHSYSPIGLLQDGSLRCNLQTGKEIVMDTTTYASVAMLPNSVAQDHMRFVRQDQELLPLDLSMIKR